MTPLPAFSETVVERKDLPEYEIPGRCANPRCPNRADHPHEIRPRSQTAGMAWWVELPGRYMIGNRIGLCAGCHARTDDHSVAIIWDEDESTLAWVDLSERWAEPLDPMPPIHKDSAGAGGVEGSAGQTAGRLDEPAIGDSGQEVGLTAPAEMSGEAGVQPVPEEGAPSDMAVLARRVQATKEFLKMIDEDDPGVPTDPSETVMPVAAAPEPMTDFEPVPTSGLEEFVLSNISPGSDQVEISDTDTGELLAVVPVELEPEIEPPELGRGSGPLEIAKAKEATALATGHATEITTELLPVAAPWRADILIHPEEQRVEVLHGDLRVGAFLEEAIEKAKRTPKPRAPRADDPDREHEPAKARRTWSLNVPSNERTDTKVAAGEDGYSIIEELLELLRQKLGHEDSFTGWKYIVLVESLAWMALNYTDEGEG